jgi:hypothetical protein
MLADLDYAVANAAAERLIATSKWIPTIAEIREACLAITAGPKVPGGEAWGAVMRAIGRFGAYRTPGVEFNLEDPIAQRCVLSLGWRELCLSENAIADRARFIELYDQLATTTRVAALSEGLPAQRRLAAANQHAVTAGAPRPQLPASPARCEPAPSAERAGSTDVAAAMVALGYRSDPDPESEL